MVKRYSVSVSDELGEKIDQWKNELSPSTIFQQAMSAEIAKKEGFVKRIKEDQDMESIIERLRQEKKASENKYFEFGKEEGLEWAKAANYEDLVFTVNKDLDDLIGLMRLHWRAVPDEGILLELRNYFCGQLYEELELPFDKDNDDLDPFVVEWLDGWLEGVQAFWREISDKL
jgi:hypothetical protein